MNRLSRLLSLFLVLFVAACASQTPRPFAPLSARPPLILVSIDGFRADYLARGITPTLAALAADGVRAQALRPAFPTLTFPNHYTLVTGLYPDHHGIVANTMEDPAIPHQRFSIGNRKAVGDERWWDEATPIWVSAQQQGLHTATMFWVGSEAPNHGVRPDHWFPFDARVTPDRRVDTVLGWLDLPPAQRPAFITLYFDQVDHQAHEHGPDSPQVDAAMREVDDALARLMAGLRRRGIADRVNLIIVSDHGMTATSRSRVVYLDDLVPLAAVHVVTWGVLAGLAPKPGQANAVDRALLAPHAHMRCWKKGEMPARLHYGTNPRIPPLLCLADDGWVISSHAHMAGEGHFSLGEHGYDNADPKMRALFIAHGPAFRRGLVVPEFDNVDVYPLLAHLIGIQPAANDGSYAQIEGMLRPAAR